MVTKNVGGIDRGIRIVLGLVLLALVSLVLVGPQTRWAYFGLVGCIPLITGAIGYCPPYTLLGISTCKQ